MAFNKYTLIIVFLSFFIGMGNGYSQQKELCGYDDYHNYLMKNDAAYKKAQQKFESKYVNAFGGKILANDATYQLPIVVHVYLEDQSYLSDQQIIDGIDLTNDQLRGITGGIDTDIELVFAKVDEDGNCFDGINRINALTGQVWLTGLCGDLPDDTWTSSSALNGLNWNTADYFNIWVVKASCPGGTGVFPAPGAGDGIMVIADAFGYGPLGVPASSNSYGGTIAHEIGHYLSLLHTFSGCHAPADCLTAGDRVCDTPATGQSSPGSFQDCSAVQSECDGESGIVPKDNYMGYKSFCRETFTPGQVARMHFKLQTDRANLWSAENLANLQFAQAPLNTLSETISNKSICLDVPNGSISLTVDETENAAIQWQWFELSNSNPFSSAANLVENLAAGEYQVQVNFENDCISYMADFEIVDEFCAGDFNGDNSIGAADLSLFLSAFGTFCDCCEDLDGNGVVTATDLSMFLSIFGTSCSGPEGSAVIVEKLLNLYPNPSASQVNIQSELFNHLDGLTFEIVNIEGRKMKTGKLNSAKSVLDISDISAGYYRFNLLYKEQYILLSGPLIKMENARIGTSQTIKTY